MSKKKKQQSWWQERQERLAREDYETSMGTRDNSRRGWWKSPVDEKDDKKEDRRSFRLDKISALTGKALAVAKKRKWLVFLIGLLIAAYLLVSSGGLGGGLEKIKALF